MSEPRISVVIPTLGRPELLRRVLGRLGCQTSDAFEVVVVADAAEEDLAALDAAVDGRARRLQAQRPGASAARNVGWRAARAPLVLFLDDDVLPDGPLIAEHLTWHEHHPAETVGVLGHVRWADELRVTPFMRWLERGIQFDYPSIRGDEAHWGYFYTANVSVKRALLERAGGFEETRLPFGYEDLELALRMSQHGFALRYNRAAVAEHVHPMDLDFWRRRVARIAVSERAFCALHPEIPPYFHGMFSAAAAAPPADDRGARAASFVPRRLPVLGPRVWAAADAYWRRQLAEPFLAAWDAVED